MDTCSFLPNFGQLTAAYFAIIEDMTNLILVLGLPATGKTSLSRKIGSELKLPIVCRDDIKEIMFDSIGWSDREWSKKVGQASFSILDYFVEEQLKFGNSIIIESPFNPKFENKKFQMWQDKYNLNIIQVLCHTEGKVLVERFIERSNSESRHPGHRDESNLDEFKDGLIKGEAPSLDIKGAIIRVDTTNFDSINYKQLINDVENAMK